MLQLKTKTLSLPHLSLSRNSSPSRSHPPTPTTGDSDPVLVDRSTASSPKNLAVDSAAAEGTAPPPPKPSRRSSIGASLSALTSRSSSPAAGAPAPAAPLKSPSLPANLALTPAAGSTTASAPASPGGGSGGSTRPTRSVSDDKSGLRPLRSSRSTTTSASSSSKKQRSKSSDRAIEVAALSAAASSASTTTTTGPPAPAPAVAAAAKTKKPGLMASFGRGRGLALGSSQSQPGTSRATATAVRANSLGPDFALGAGAGAAPGAAAAGTRSPVLGVHALGAGGTPATHSGAATPSAGMNGHGHGHAHAHAHGSKGQSVQLHQLAESYVGKVGLRLGEAVNKVFLPVPTGPGGIVDKAADKAEAPFGGHAVVCKGRAAPRLPRAKEVGELITAELQAASHDPYLLRTLLRSSVLKALSLFLTRLSALLLVASPTDPALAPSLFAAPRTLKDADSLSIPLRFNLQIVRCAYEVKHALRLVADPSAGFPHFVDETLKPWRVKLAELINRVMGPFVQSARLAVGELCARARLEGAVGAPGESPSSSAAAAAAASSLGLHGLAHPIVPPAAPASVKSSATSQLRSLSLGRSAPHLLAITTPVPPTSSGSGGNGGVLSSSAAAAAQAAATAGPPWLRDLSALLDAVVRVVTRLEGGTDADKWVVSVATAASWKAMLHLSARAVVGAETGAKASAASAAAFGGEKGAAHPGQAPLRRGLLGGVGIKKTPSPPQSPPLPAVEVGGASMPHVAGPASAVRVPSAADIAFVRLLSDLELLEARLKAFLVAGLSTPATVLAPSSTSAAPAPSACPAASTPTGCGLCRTGRTFDDESSDSSSDDDDGEGPAGVARRPDPSRESRLALSAMREAMQALSAMVVVVRASKDLGVLRRAIEGPGGAGGGAAAAGSAPADAEAPLTPSALFALQGAPPAPRAPVSAPAPVPAPASASPTAPLSAQCPTLSSALVTLPPLLLLHLVAARVAPSSTLRLPHELWALRGGWDEYAAELRGFAAAEEWELEVAAELAAEAERVLSAGAAGAEVEALEALRAAARRTAQGA